MNCCNPPTLEEMILELDIDEETEREILKEISYIREENNQLNKYLENCHRKINKLETTIVESTVLFSTTIRNMQ